MDNLSRRDLARVAAGLAAGAALPSIAEPAGAQASSAAPSPTNGYIGPLTGVTATAIAGRVFDPVAYSRGLLAAAPRALRFQASTRLEAERWQAALRTKLVELLGGIPAGTVPLRAETLEVREFPRYRREKLVFDSAPGVSVVAYVLAPVGRPRPLATMICVPGHGRGVDDIVGIDEAGRDRSDKAGYQHDFAIQVVEAGMAAVAIEPMGFGARRDERNARRGLGQKACDPTAGGALLVGQTLLGWRVRDVMRTLDLIAERPELDASRVGCMGISGGGTVTLFSAALEPRLGAAMVSGYLNTFRDSIGSLVHCADNYVPGILDWAEMHDVAGLIAPRPLFVESGTRDDIFPIAASTESVARVRDVYRVFGADAALDHEIFDGEHSFWGRRGIPFLASRFGAAR
ncbi:MAG: acetylxylan esterase [Acidobacteria bacterium]|nr:acetylxylan esterase [Acidobacteriota bacterium]